MPVAAFAGEEARLRSCILSRFSARAAPSVPPDLPRFSRRVLTLYQSYWRAALLQPERREAEQERLRQALIRSLRLSSRTAMNDIEAPLAQRLESEGMHVLMGVTAPLRELMLWRSQTIEMRDVPLPEGVHRTRVVLLDGFASLGWAGFATCDRSSTGGWVRPDGIYAVRPGWGDLNGEPFRVSFLGHEAQHFADRERFGDLPSWELEYRAKLAELAMADVTQARLLSAFASNQSDDPAIPHSYANKRMIAALRARLGIAPGSGFEGMVGDRVRRAADALLREDSRRRERAPA